MTHVLNVSMRVIASNVDITFTCLKILHLNNKIVFNVMIIIVMIVNYLMEQPVQSVLTIIF